MEQLTLDGSAVNTNPVQHVYTHLDREIAHKKLHKHIAWEAENPEAEAYLEQRFLEETAKGGKVGGNLFVNELRRVDIPGRTKGDYARISNDSSAILIRQFVNRHPERAEHVRMNACIWDEEEFVQAIAAL